MPLLVVTNNTRERLAIASPLSPLRRAETRTVKLTVSEIEGISGVLDKLKASGKLEWGVSNDPNTPPDSQYVSLDDINTLITAGTSGGATGPASGDLAGTYPSPSVVALQGQAVSVTAPLFGESLVWDGTAYTPAAPPGGTDIASNEIVVGLSAAPYSHASPGDVHIVDPGDGTGIENALLSASAMVTSGFIGVTVKLLAGAYTVNPSALISFPLTIPSGVSLKGDGRLQTTVSGGDRSTTAADNQVVFVMSSGSRLSDLSVISPIPTSNLGATNGVGTISIPQNTSDVTIENVTVTLMSDGVLGRGTYSAIYAKAPIATNVRIKDVSVTGYNTPNNCVGVRAGAQFSYSPTTEDPILIDGLSMKGGSRAVFGSEVSGIRIKNVTANFSNAAVTGVELNYQSISADLFVKGPTISNCDFYMGPNTGAAPIVTSFGVSINAWGGSKEVKYIRVSDIRVLYPTDAGPLFNHGLGISVTAHNGTGQNSGMSNIDIRNIAVEAEASSAIDPITAAVIVTQDAVAGGFIKNVRISNVYAQKCQKGVWLMGTTAVMSNVLITECFLNGAALGVSVDGGNIRTLISGCTLPAAFPVVEVGPDVAVQANNFVF